VGSGRDGTDDRHPTPATQGRLVEAIRKYPEDVAALLEHLPPAQEVQAAHPLQSTGKAHEVWAAIPKDGETRIGRHDTGTFTFSEAARFRGIELTSDRMWVDERGSRVLVAKHGDVLELPFRP
jgi:hypothetical protein